MTILTKSTRKVTVSGNITLSRMSIPALAGLQGGDMEAAESNEVLEKGADYEVVEWIEDDYGNPINISEDTFRAEVRDTVGGDLLASFTFEIFLDGAIYKYRRKMAQSVINALTVKQAVWDQFQEFADGSVAKMMRGTVTVTGNVTDPTGA